jgi:hypothetical protein
MTTNIQTNCCHTEKRAKYTIKRSNDQTQKHENNKHASKQTRNLKRYPQTQTENRIRNRQDEKTTTRQNDQAKLQKRITAKHQAHSVHFGLEIYISQFHAPGRANEQTSKPANQQTSKQGVREARKVTLEDRRGLLACATMCYMTKK